MMRSRGALRSFLVVVATCVGCASGQALEDAPAGGGAGGHAAGDASHDASDTSPDVADQDAGDADASPDVADQDAGDADTSPDVADQDAGDADTSPDVADQDAGDADTSPDVADANPDTDTWAPDAGGPKCGNGTVEATEACDDGNTTSGDGCSSACAWETSCGGKNARATIACGGTASGDFYGKWSDVNGECGFATSTSQDQVLVFTPATSAVATVTYTASPDRTDMAMFVLAGSCHAKLCTTDSRLGDRHTVTFDAVAGTTYFIVIEAPSFQPSYTATLACQ